MKKIYNDGKQKTPQVIAKGKFSNETSFVIMPRLGVNLSEIFARFNKSFSKLSVLSIGL